MQTSGLDDNPDTVRIARVVPSHHTLAAVEDEAVVGFVDSFTTLSAEGVRRLEVDLLGVLPEQQGRGIARRLVTEAVKAASQYNVDQVRALVRDSNAASQPCFAACGFQSHRTYAKEPKKGSSDKVKE
jgi:ribosomal protein S18 acetylase RimI-like enzyme